MIYIWKMITFLHVLLDVIRVNFAEIDLLPLTPKKTSGCFGAPGNLLHELSFICASGEQIAIETVEYGSKIDTATNCTEGLATERFDECCTKDFTDCNIFYDKGKDYFVNCVGYQSCNFQVTRLDNVNIDYPQCASSLRTTIYMNSKYYCVPTDASTINMADSSVQVTATHVYVQSFLYPDPDSLCSGVCSIETSCHASITTTVLDANFSCQGTDEGFSNDIQDCDNPHNVTFVHVIEQSDGGNNFLRFTLNETGRLWIMFKSSDPLSNVTVKCGSEADQNSSSICITKSTAITKISTFPPTGNYTVQGSQSSSSERSTHASTIYSIRQDTTSTQDENPGTTDNSSLLPNNYNAGVIAGGLVSAVSVVVICIFIIAVIHKRCSCKSNQVEAYTYNKKLPQAWM